MEQRIGSSSQPLEGAGFDPAFIPGLTSPGSGEPEDAKPADTGREESEPEPEQAPEPAEEAPGTQDEPSVDGPVFEAADRRARIVADHRGVRLALDDQECEFRWDEIGAVETETPRFGKRFTVTVHTPERRWYYLEIEAASRSRFAQWETALDAVLDAYFEDAEDTADAEDAEGTEDAKGTEDAEEEAARP
ncbi:hypothetical protein [Streptomyces sp. enrichment culture]|uniref:hypothetical protein n=1 Tax=Streptomyces sp. enrichment culture TaxID=1795815 RepID=UPI003F578FB2